MAYLTIQQGVVLVYLHILQGADRTFFDVYRGVGALRFYLLHLDLKLLLGLGVRGGGGLAFSLSHQRGFLAELGYPDLLETTTSRAEMRRRCSQVHNLNGQGKYT